MLVRPARRVVENVLVLLPVDRATHLPRRRSASLDPVSSITFTVPCMMSAAWAAANGSNRSMPRPIRQAASAFPDVGIG